MHWYISVIKHLIQTTMLYVLDFSFCYSNRSGQFRHSRLKDGANLEVANPMYMPQSTEEDDESHQPLDHPYDFDPEKVSLILLTTYSIFLPGLFRMIGNLLSVCHIFL